MARHLALYALKTSALCVLTWASVFDATKLSYADDKARLSPGFIAFCSEAKIKKVILDVLNESDDFKSRKITVVDFQNARTLSIDPAIQKFSCHGKLVAAGGKSTEGTFIMEANDKGSSVDWYDDNAEQGFAAMGEAGPSVPADEVNFIRAVKTGQNAYAAASTDFARGTNRPVRASAICAALKSVTVKNWVGQLTGLSTNDEGKGVVTINLDRGIKLTTWNNSFSDIGNDTLVEPRNPLFTKLATLQISDMVEFSGTFFPSKTDCIRESSFTMRGSMLEPEFIMRFTDIKKVSGR